jgi:hypothetical protein
VPRAADAVPFQATIASDEDGAQPGPDATAAGAATGVAMVATRRPAVRPPTVIRARFIEVLYT